MFSLKYFSNSAVTPCRILRGNFHGRQPAGIVVVSLSFKVKGHLGGGDFKPSKTTPALLEGHAMAPL